MTIYITRGMDRDGAVITLMARAESERGGIVGDLVQEIRPGETFLGKTYEQWDSITEPSIEIN